MSLVDAELLAGCACWESRVVVEGRTSVTVQTARSWRRATAGAGAGGAGRWQEGVCVCGGGCMGRERDGRSLEAGRTGLGKMN